MRKLLNNKKAESRLLPKNKKGIEMAISTIIVIVLGLVVLVILIMGFSSGWTNLWDRVTGFGGGKVNVQSVIQGCQLACSINAQYDYCGKTSKLVFTIDKNSPDIDKTGNYNCKALDDDNIGGLNCDVAFGDCKAINPVCSGTIGSKTLTVETSKSKCETKTGGKVVSQRTFRSKWVLLENDEVCCATTPASTTPATPATPATG